MSGRIYFLGDTHIGHKKIWEPRGFSSLEEHDDAIADSIFNCCGRDDSLYILGDICFGGADKFHDVMMGGLLRYRKRHGNHLPQSNERPKFVINVVQGNHDKSKMLHQLIDMGWITNYHSLREFRSQAGHKVVATHVPIHPACLERWAINAHAHLHAQSLNDHRFKCVSWEQTHGPVWIEDLVRDFNEQTSAV